MSVITRNLELIKSQLEELSLNAGRQRDAVELIVVSKTRSLEEVQEVVLAGQHSFGENTIQDALTKIPEISAPYLDWHFIGHLQSKKAISIPGNFQWVHTVDSIKLAQKLSAAMIQHEGMNKLNCLLQVNVAKESSKSGLLQDEVIPFLNELQKQKLPGLNWRGLMTIGVQDDDKQTVKAFSGLRSLLEQCQQASGLKNFDQLSMGMSNDYSIAIREGSTMVRIGTAVFGDRKSV